MSALRCGHFNYSVSTASVSLNRLSDLAELTIKLCPRQLYSSINHSYTYDLYIFFILD